LGKDLTKPKVTTRREIVKIRAKIKSNTERIIIQKINETVKTLATLKKGERKDSNIYNQKRK
jgi:lipase chaperone LimK